jgi:transcriptional regulator with XRE-family HTH domain
MSSGNRTPNRRLAWERLQRGWSHEELRRQLVAAMAKDGETDTGLSRNTVRRWETGERWPEPRYRMYLVSLLGKTADQLGLLEPDELAMRPVNEGPGQLDQIDLLWRFMTMLGGWGQGIDRETFLRRLLALGASPLLASLPPLGDEAGQTWERFAREADATRPLTAPAVEDYETITVRHRRLYLTPSPWAFYASVKAHVELGAQLLGKNAPDSLRQRLAAALAESAMLAGRIAFFDLRHPQTAELEFKLALHATEDAAHHALAAAVLAHSAFVSADAGDAATTRGVLRAAHAHASHHTGPVTRAWLHAVESEVMAKLGDERACLNALARAESALGGTATRPEPEWLDFFDASRLAGFAGYASLTLGRMSSARAALEDSLAHLAPEAAKQRAVILADLAATYTGDDVEEACTMTSRALGQLRESWYGTAFERVQAVRRALEPRRDARVVRILEEEIRQAVPIGAPARRAIES